MINSDIWFRDARFKIFANIHMPIFLYLFLTDTSTDTDTYKNLIYCQEQVSPEFTCYSYCGSLFVVECILFQIQTYSKKGEKKKKMKKKKWV